MKKKKKLYVTIVCVILLAALVYILFKPEVVNNILYGAVDDFHETSYQVYLDSHGYNNIMSSALVNVDVMNFEVSDGMTAEVDDKGVFTAEKGKITWNFYVEESGFYNIELTYITMPGTTSQIKRSLYIDGEAQYEGMNLIVFNRIFTDADRDIKVKNKNEIKPKSVEIFEEQTVFIDDAQKRNMEPYKFYFEKGHHTISFESIKEPMKVLAIALKSDFELLLYEEVIDELKSKYTIYNGENIVTQAERTGDFTKSITKSSPTITMQYNAVDPYNTPYHPYYITYNTIGGSTWRNPGEKITWEIDVPEEGLYKISLRGKQSISRGIASYRRLEINGEVPFKEAESLRFEYNADMKNYILGNGEEEYLFYLKEGINTLSLEVVLGGFGEAYIKVNESVKALNDLYRQIVRITGVDPQKFIDYDIVIKLPKLPEILKRERINLSQALDYVIETAGVRGENASLIQKMVTQLERLEKKPADAALKKEVDNLKNNITALAEWMVKISDMPLELDSITLLAQDMEPSKASAGFIKRFSNNTVRFFATFFYDNTKIAMGEEDSKDAIKVWIPTGRDQAQILRELIDDSFTPEYNILVNLELIPIDVVLPSTLAGVGPDVVLSIDQTKMMDFAMRNSLVELSALDGFDEIAKNYFPSAIESVTYVEGIYGLPETQDFQVMFYRKDILDSLGITPPETFEDLRKIVPILQMNKYEMTIPGGTTIFMSMLAQRGYDLYLGAGKDYGIQTALTNDYAMEIFREFTDFFTGYKLPYPTDFSNRFRTGENPIGIASYTEFNKLELLAPEIKGLWSFELIPGTLKEDGSIDHTSASSTTQCIMLKTAADKGFMEEAWTFMKWWISTETQTAYANAIESVLGSSARYATANKDVLKNLPWSTADSEKLLDQFEQTKGFPPVPGHYITTRQIDFTFKRVVSDAKYNPRVTLYLNAKEINIELTKKRREFGLSFID